MRTGDARRGRGFTYLWLLFALALGGVALAAAGQSGRHALQRDKERELLFRGNEIARAIASYRAASPASAPAWPTRWDDLLEDRRGPAPHHHLRRLYTDPFTGEADWVRLGAERGELRGVRSRSQARALMTLEFARADGAAAAPCVCDRVFGADEAPRHSPLELAPR